MTRHIRQAIAESRFTGEGYRKIWARLMASCALIWAANAPPASAARPGGCGA